jgi:hypothetical protein
MLRKSITYTDYNGAERTENFYFNLTKAELMEMELSVSGGFTDMIQRIIDAQDTPTIVKVFKELILKSYGEKSPDGKRFVKSAELADAFAQTEAYSNLFMELATDSKAASDFVNGIIPQDMADQIKSETPVVPENYVTPVPVPGDANLIADTNK